MLVEAVGFQPRELVAQSADLFTKALTAASSKPASDNVPEWMLNILYDNLVAACNAATDASATSDASAPVPQCVTVEDCPTQNPCLIASCTSKGTCAFSAKADASPCDDGNACTTKDVCKGGSCSGGLGACSDGNVCTDDFCDSAKGCGSKSNTAGCNVTGCSVGDTCKDGSCVASQVERLWTKTYTDDSSGFPKYKEYLNAAVALDNDQMIAVGSNAPESYYPPTAVAMRVTAEGTRSWFKGLPVQVGSSYAMSAVQRADGVVAVGGMTGNCGFVTQMNGDGSFGSSAKVKYGPCVGGSNGVQTVMTLLERKVAGKVKLTAVIHRDEYGVRTAVADVEPDGTVTASYQHPAGDYVWNEPRMGALLPDGRIVVAGRSNEAGGAGGDDAFLIWLQPDLTGAVRKRYGSSINEMFQCVAVLPDGSLVAGGARWNGSLATEAFFMRIASDGTQIWQKAIGGAGHCELRSVVVAPDGGLFFVGKRPEAVNTAKSDLWMMALDADGDPFWSKQYGAQGIDEGGHALVRHSSGRLTAVGWKIGNLGLSDYLAIRVNDGGAPSCAAAGACAGKTAASCADGNPCTASVCVGDACTHKAHITGCEDGDACTVAEVCNGAGTCGSGEPVYCDDGNPCTTETCDKAKGCVYSQVVDSTPCATGKACLAGVCQ